MRVLGTSTALVCVLLPQFASAAVVINEIAWMGSATSANDEWIELYNNGSEAVILDGWQLTDGQDLTIDLSGTLPAGAFGVLERTDDTSASGSAFLIYTGALSNGGATLKLTRADGGIEDQVAGGENWENIGGDNTTKETAQHSPGGWITGTQTPGKTNVTAGSSEPENEPAASDSASRNRSQTKDSSGSGSDEKEPPPVYNLMLTINAPTRVYVNQPIELSVIPSGLSDAVIDSVTYEWNFGDVHTAMGKETSHSYAYAGEYVVTVYGTFASHETVARHTITVLPVTISLALTGGGDVQIHNNARYEIDLSGYTLNGRTPVTFPDYTFLLPQATLTVPWGLLGDVPVVSAILSDQEDVLVAHTGGSGQKKDTKQGIVAGARTQAEPVAATPETDAFVFASDSAPVATGTPPADTERTQHTDRTTDTGTVPVAAWPYLGLIGIVSVGMATLFLRSNTDRT
ncbi:MAG: lamin tail domain-containing protein [Candidatus Paceibacterota bacterium]